ncbi:hypothetical protein C5167_025651 [Papaver somniferum]|uniref:Mediator of RNA polymerase II transcription subunit 6 n=1 Tax=Papaver somniferum TaxID=3469 RepID=A0A4Y7JVB7_PAPSO|nr:hypothetical protein C5167_025651 [Papaver somniferum]
MATPMMPPGGNPNMDGNPQLPPTPGTDMTGICFRDQLWLNSYPLDRNLVFDYFALSPFYDFSCNNEQLRMQQIHPLDISHLQKMTGIKFSPSEVMEPHLFVIKKQKREAERVLDGSIYQAPQLANVFAARIVYVILVGVDMKQLKQGDLAPMVVNWEGTSSLAYIKGFYNGCIQVGENWIRISIPLAYSRVEREKKTKKLNMNSYCKRTLPLCAVDGENEITGTETKVVKETIDFKEVKRIDHILGALQRKLQPAPPQPPYPEGYVPPASEADKGPENPESAEPQPPPLDPIIDQGPSKRMKYN